ncbi:hypothetical protein HOG21_01410 [bacterium]|jgi:hypothetical protein|nr:hypothetical protein [bacterium]
MSIFSQDNSSITHFTLIHFCPISVHTGSISSNVVETNNLVFTHGCLTILSIFIIHSSISDTCSLNIADTSSGLFLDNMTFGAHVSFFDTSATYKYNLVHGAYVSLDTCSDFGNTTAFPL